LAISVSMDSRLTLPGTDLISDSACGSPLSDSALPAAAASSASRAGVRAEPRCHPQRERLLGLVQGRADDPVAAARGRRLDPLGAAPGQQFPADPVSAALGLADAGGQPFGELAAFLGAALPEPEVAADLRPVVLGRVPGPLIETKVGGADAGLPGDELHRVAGQLRPPAREPAVPA
jgi:hypothetical protein